MAAAAPSPLASSVEKTNGAKLSRLLIDGGTMVLRNVLDRYHPPANLAADLNANYRTLNNLYKKRVLHQSQWDKLFPPGGATPDSKAFDITLLFLLLTNICGLSPPPSGWHKPPPSRDTSFEANLARVKLYRNELYGHVTSTGVKTAVFNVKWQEISSVLLALGLNPAEVVRLKAAPCGEDYITAVIEWVKSDEEIQSQLREVLETQQEARQMQKEDHRTLQGTHQMVEEVIKTQIMAHETLQQVKKTAEGEKKEEILKKLVEVNSQKAIDYHTDRYQEGTRVSFFEKIEKWLDDRSSSNRVMVISGNAGMGKSVISAIVCKRMQEAGRLSGSHFCQHDKAHYRNAKIMLQSLASQLADSLPEYKDILVKMLSWNLGIELNNMEVKDLFEVLFEKPLIELKDLGRNILMVIDGLDESEYQGRNELLDVIANHFTKLPCWIRFFVATRQEINIADSLKSFKPLQLELNNEENLTDIRLLFEKRLIDVIQQDHQEVILAELVKKSEGLILYAHLLSDFISENVPLLTLEQLGNALPSGISSVYLTYFQRLETELRKELKIEEEQVLTVLSALAAAREPLQQDFVCEMMLSGKRSLTEKRKVMKAITCISALLPVRDGCIHFFHKSVKDWLTDISAYGQHNFTVDINEGHEILSRLCAVELDDVRRKGVSDLMFSDTTKYALQHGVGHMLELDDETRGCSLEEVAKKYVIDLEIVYSKLCVNSATVAEDIERLQNLESFPVLSHESVLNTLLFLLRKYHSAFTKRPGIFFQTVLNEGGTALSAEASKLLEDKHPEIAYMEYLYKDVHEDAAQAVFRCSSPVACFDVSPQLDYLVCECKDATIHLWSLHTGHLQWVRPAKIEKRYFDENKTYRAPQSSPVCSCYRSVVFHPTKEVVLPGILNQAYALDGDLKPLFPESNCSFTVCSIVTSGGEIRMLTDCLDNARCIIMWSLENGSEITRITRKEDVLSFACTRDGKMLTISHSSGSICLVDVTKGSETLAQVTCSKACGMIKFTPDNQYIFCFHKTLPETRSRQDRYVFQLKITRCNNETFSLKVLGDKVSYIPLEHESCSEAGFLSGDPFSCIFESFYLFPVEIFVEGAFMFVLSKQSVLRSFPGNSSIAMFTSTGLRSHTASIHSHSKFTAKNIAFTRAGDIVYVVATETNVDGPWVRVMAWDVSSGELNAEKSIQTGKNKRIVPVKQGILLTATNDCPELWNFKLSECIRRWPHVREVTDMTPISEERVACLGKRDEVNILDTTCTDVIATIPFSYKTYEHTSQLLRREAVTCNSRCQLLCQLLSNNYHSVQLWDGTDILWECRWPHSSQCSYILPGMFSPTEEFVVISALTPEGDQGVYLLDAQSGKTCRMLCRGNYFFGCNFVSDEECLIDSKDASGDYLLRLFNIKSGDLLGVLVKQFRTFCLASCPLKRLVAIDVVANDDSKRVFQVIQVKLPRDKDNKKKNKGMVNPPENPTKEKNQSLVITKGRGLDTLDEIESKQAAVEVNQPEDAIRTSTMKFEADHDECVRVLPYKDKDGQLVVRLYVYHGKSGIPKELEAAAQEWFGEMDVNLEFFDLYNKPSRVLNFSPLEYPSGKPNRLDAENVDNITEIISRNLDIFSKHRNITALQPSFKVTNSSQTANSCIAVYVLGKGHIPLGESEIPRTVDGCLLDIVDGFWFEAGSPWTPNKAQEQFEVLPWGISIGVEGVEASGTLGGVVKDERNPGVLYALSCDHVLNKGTKQREIIHPGLIDSQNKKSFLLKAYIDLSARLIPGPKSVSDLCETDEFETKLEKVIRINQENLRLLKDDRTIPSEITSNPNLLKRYGYFFHVDEEIRRKRLSILRGKLPQLSGLVKDIQQCLVKKPRIVAKYTTGKRGNVERSEGTYFIDAAIAELSPDEANKLQSSEQTVINGTEYYPNGTCRPATTSAILNATKLCKSGRTTEYTESTEGVCTSQNTPTYLKTKFVYGDNKVLPTAEMKYYYCESCNETVRCILDNEKSHACSGCPTGKGKNYVIKFLPNLLCIPSERRTPFADTGDSGSVIFEIDEDYQGYDRLSGFGLLFGVFDSAYRTCALASPLQIVLEELSRQVSDSCELRLVSDYY